jgi:hypothetical protein
MDNSLGKRLRQHPKIFWGCEGDHLYNEFPHKGDRMRTIHNIQEADIVDDEGRSMPRIYATLENRQANHQFHMIEVQGKIDNQPISILIDFGASHSYIDPKSVERFKSKRCKHEMSCVVQLAIRTKRKNNELVKDFPVRMNGVSTKADLNIIPLGSYDFLIGMDCLDKHRAILDCYNKFFTCLDEEGNSRTSQGIPRPISVREFSTLQLKIGLRKGCQIYASHMEEPTKYKMKILGDYLVLKEYEDVFGEL